MMEGPITPKINAEEKENTKSYYSSNNDEKFYKLIVTTTRNECNTRILLFLTVTNIYEFFTKHQRYIADKFLNKSNPLTSISYSIEDDVEIKEIHYLNKNSDPYDVSVILSNKNHPHIISLEYDLLKETFKENDDIDIDSYKVRIYKTTKNDVFVRLINEENKFESSIAILYGSNKMGLRFWDFYLEKYHAKYSK